MSQRDAMRELGNSDGQMTIEMVQKAYAESTFHGKPDQMYFSCTPEEYEQVKAALDKMFS